MAKIDAKPIKVVVTGPESTGKSTLSLSLADHFKVDLVPEYAREYLLRTRGIYSQKDLLEIAKGQIESENKALNEGHALVICDTSLEVIRVWSEWKYGSCDNFIREKAETRLPDLFLLLTPDIPWQHDALRENPNDRMALFKKYQEILKEYDTPIEIIVGNSTNRFATSVQAINNLL